MGITFKSSFPGMGTKTNTGSAIAASTTSDTDYGVYLNALRSLNEKPTDTSIYTTYGMPFIAEYLDGFQATRGGYYDGVDSTKTDEITLSKFTKAWTIVFYISPSEIPDGTTTKYQTILGLYDQSNPSKANYFMLTEGGIALQNLSLGAIVNSATASSELTSNMNLIASLSYDGTEIVFSLFDMDADSPSTALCYINIPRSSYYSSTSSFLVKLNDQSTAGKSTRSLCRFAYIGVYGNIYPATIKDAYYLFMRSPLKFSKDLNGVVMSSYAMVKDQYSPTYDLMSSVINSCTFDTNDQLYIKKGSLQIGTSYSNSTVLTINDDHKITSLPAYLAGPLYSLKFNDVVSSLSSSTKVATYTIGMTKYPTIGCNFKYNDSSVDEVLYYEDGTAKDVKFVNTVDDAGTIHRVYASPATIYFSCTPSLDDMYIQRLTDWAGNSTTDNAIHGYYYSSTYYTNVAYSARLGETWKVHTASADMTVTITGKTVNISSLSGTDAETCGYTVTGSDLCLTLARQGGSACSTTTQKGGISPCTSSMGISS